MLSIQFENMKLTPTEFFGQKIPKGMLLMGKGQSAGTFMGQVTCMMLDCREPQNWEVFLNFTV